MVSSISYPLLSTSVHHVRSISMPNKSHPITLQVEEELTHLKSCETSSSSTANVETVCGSITLLKHLYTSVNDLISLPHTQQALLHKKLDQCDHNYLVDELLDQSMRLLDVCGSIKDVMEQAKEHIRKIQSALRRRKVEGLTSDSFSVLKMKDARRAIVALKQTDNKIGGNNIVLLDLDHHHLSSLVISVRETSALSVSIFGSLVSYISSVFVSKPKSIEWTMVLGLVHKPKTVSVEQPRVSNVALESYIQVIEESLECMCRTLIKARVSLLNIRSH